MIGKKYKSNFIDFRGRWVGNRKLLSKVIDLVKIEEDWIVPLKPILTEVSNEKIKSSCKARTLHNYENK